MYLELSKLISTELYLKNNSRPPGHHLYDVNVGLFKINSSVVESYVQVVSKPRINVP